MIHKVLKRNLLLRLSSIRYFSARPFEAQWSESTPYKPTLPITYTNGKYLVFHQESKGVHEIPYEIKEISLRNGVGFIMSELLSILVTPIAILSPFFAGNFCFQVYRRMIKAISKIELIEGGKMVKLTKKIGGSITVPISGIKKLEDESKLMITYSEPYLYPIDVTLKKGITKTYLIYGQGFEPIKNGEVFRAIINGKELASETDGTKI